MGAPGAGPRRAIRSESSAGPGRGGGSVTAAAPTGMPPRGLRALLCCPWPLRRAPVPGAALAPLALLGLVLVLSGCDVLPPGYTKPGIAILYGVGDYSGDGTVDTNDVTLWNIGGPTYTLSDLAGPPKDVDNLHALFAAQGWDTSRTKKNGDAISTNFEADLQNAALQAVEGQRVVIYFSGHGGPSIGAPSGGQEFFMLHDTAATGSADGVIYPSRLRTLIQPLLDKKARVIVIIDACNSGGFVADGAYVNGLPWDESPHDYYTPDPEGGAWGAAWARWFDPEYAPTSTQGHGALSAPNLWVMSAAGPAEESYEAGLEGESQGVFTYYLRYAAARGDGNRDGAVSFYEAYRYTFLNLKYGWNRKYSLSYDEDYLYLPHTNGNPYDLVLFGK